MKTHPLFAFPFSDISAVDNTGTDFDGAGRWDNFDFLDTNTLNSF